MDTARPERETSLPARSRPARGGPWRTTLDSVLDTRSRRTVASRGAVLAVLSALTIVGPLAGATGSPATPAAAPAGGAVVSALSTGAVAVQQATALAADPEAPARAVTAASRSQLREGLECPVESDANGALSAVMNGGEPVELILPVAEGTYRVTSGYGPRGYPFPGMHEGTDFAGPVGTPLYAVADGVVTYAGGGRDGRSGQIVILTTEIGGRQVDVWYGHMYTSGVYVTEGQRVSMGQVIAGIGNSGRSTGPHVHVEVHVGEGRTVDPVAFLRANGAQPVSAAARCA